EDHLLRLMRDAGLPTPRPYGFVEMTPEREYLIVMEFFEGSQEIRDAPVDDRVIDDALPAVRRTPWRQAVDLANMMLTLALASTPDHVYERALHIFAADDVAEAFAAC